MVGLVEAQAEEVDKLHTAALGLVGNWGTGQEHLEKALQDERRNKKSEPLRVC